MNPSASSGAPCLFLISGFVSEEKDAIGSKVVALGGRFQNTSTYHTRCTHLICSKPIRSEKFLCACASGKWILKPGFVSTSSEKRRWQKEAKFEWGEGDLASSPGVPRGLLLAPKRWREKVAKTGRGAFSGWRAVVRVENIQNRTAVYTRLIEAGGGKCFPLNKKTAQEKLTHVIVDKCYEQDVKHLEARGIPCLIPEFLAEHLFEEEPCMDKFRVSCVTLSPSQIGKKTGDVVSSVSSKGGATPNSENFKRPRSTASRSGSNRSKQTPGSTVGGDEEMNGADSGRGVKRKLHFSPNQLREALQVLKKRKMSSQHLPLVPYTMAIPRPKKTFKCASDECKSRPFYTNLNNLVEAVAEEKQWQEALTCVASSISTEFYPPPAVLHNIMMQILQNESLPVCRKAIHILRQVLCLHSPGSHVSLAKLYLQAMVPPIGPSGHTYHNAHWTFLEAVIKRSLDGQQVNVNAPEHKDERSVKVAMETAEGLLHFLVAVMEDDYLAAVRRVETSADRKDRRDPAQCILGQVLWPSSLEQASRKVPINGAELIKYFVKAVKMATECSDWIPVLNLISLLVEMTADISAWLGEKSSWKDPQKGCKEARREFCDKLASTARQDGVLASKAGLELFLSHLKPAWMRQGVAGCLLQGFNDQLLGADSAFWANQPTTLRKIVSYFFYLVPPAPAKKEEEEGVKASPLKTISNQPLGGKQKLVTPKKKTVNVNRKNVRGETPLHQACIKNDAEKVWELLASPYIDLNAQDNAGWTPLHEACNHGNVECVQELLKFAPGGLNVSGLTEKKTLDLEVAPKLCGTTPLHDAVANEHVDVVSLLIQAGGKKLLHIKNVNGRTPLDFAKSDAMKKALNGKGTGPVISQKENLLKSPTSRDVKSVQPHPSRYRLLTGYPKTSEGGLVSEEDCEKFAIVVMALLQSYVRSHDLHRVKAEVEMIKGQKRLVERLPINNVPDNVLLHVSIPHTSTTATPTLAQTSQLPDPTTKDPLCTNTTETVATNIDSLVEDMEVFAELSHHVEGFKAHLRRLGPNGGDSENSAPTAPAAKATVCKQVSRAMRLITHLCSAVL